MVFLKMARLYRTPENLLRTELIPAFQETFGATAAKKSMQRIIFRAARPSLTTNSNAIGKRHLHIVRRVEEVVLWGSATLGIQSTGIMVIR